MTDPKPIAAFRDDAQKCLFVRYSNNTIDLHQLDSDDMFRWLGDDVDDPDPEGVVWAALTGQAPNTATISLANLPKRRPHITKFYADDEPFELTPGTGDAAKVERIRAAARKLSIDQGGVRDNQDVKALLVEIFAP